MGCASFRCLWRLPLRSPPARGVGYLVDLAFLAHEDYEEYESESGIG